MGMTPITSHVPPKNEVHFSTRRPRVIVFITKFAIQKKIIQGGFFTRPPLKVSEGSGT